jgi:putative FmdB family regulatory protein
MPIYGYDCNACGHQFEKLVRSSDTPACPSCESQDLKRQLSLIAEPAKGGNNTGGGMACETGGNCASCPCSLN